MQTSRVASKRRSWHHQSHDNKRNQMRFQVFKYLQKITAKSTENATTASNRQRLMKLSIRFETLMYQVAPTYEMYVDMKSFNSRMKVIAMQLGMKLENTTSQQTKTSTPKNNMMTNKLSSLGISKPSSTSNINAEHNTIDFASQRLQLLHDKLGNEKYQEVLSLVSIVLQLRRSFNAYSSCGGPNRERIPTCVGGQAGHCSGWICGAQPPTRTRMTLPSTPAVIDTVAIIESELEEHASLNNRNATRDDTIITTSTPPTIISTSTTTTTTIPNNNNNNYNRGGTNNNQNTNMPEQVTALFFRTRLVEAIKSIKSTTTMSLQESRVNNVNWVELIEEAKINLMNAKNVQDFFISMPNIDFGTPDDNPSITEI